MKNNEVRVEMMERVQAPCGWCFAGGVVVGVGILIIT